VRRLIVFNQVSLDGYFTDIRGDISWARRDRPDEEWNAFVAGNAKAGELLVFGRVTYELMVRYWPTPAALANDPVVAERMNNLPKVVFSRTLEKATWNNTRLVKSGMLAEIRKMKEQPGEHMTILGSGSLVLQLVPERLIDEFQMVVNPVALGEGRTMFDGITEHLTLELAQTRAFANGNVLLCYQRR
jgi:dihydrofolate reductase